MALIARKHPWKDELWNVSILPAATLPAASDSSRGPAPAGGQALSAPAVLSLCADLAAESDDEAEAA